MEKEESWSTIENEILKESISMFGQSPLDISFNWEPVSAQLISKGFIRNPTQCKDQLLNQLQPATNSRSCKRKMDSAGKQTAVFTVQPKKESLERNF